MSDVNESLILLTKNEQPWAIHSGRSEEMSNASKLLIFGQKTSASLGNQMSEFPALVQIEEINKKLFWFKNQWELPI